MGTARGKLWMRAVTFVLLSAALLVALSFPFSAGNVAGRQAIQSYAALPQNSVDVLFLSGSSQRAGLSPVALWDGYGATGYSIGSVHIPPMCMYWLLRYALQTQKPKLVVLDCYRLFKNSDVESAFTDDWAHWALDEMPVSAPRLLAACSFGLQSRSYSAMSYLLPVFRFHDRWRTMTSTEQAAETDSVDRSFLGMAVSTRVTPITQANGAPDEYRLERPNALDARYYADMIALCRRRGVEVLLVRMPTVNWDAERRAAAEAFCAAQNVPFLDCNLDPIAAQSGLSLETDYRDYAHLNIFGADKLSAPFADYLAAHYDLPDHRGDEAYAYWANASAECAAFLESAKAERFAAEAGS